MVPGNLSGVGKERDSLSSLSSRVTETLDLAHGFLFALSSFVSGPFR